MPFNHKAITIYLSTIFMFLLIPFSLDPVCEIKIHPKTLSKHLPSTTLNPNKYSIIIPSYKNRIKNLNVILSQLLCNSSKFLSKVYIYWNDFHKNIPAITENDLDIKCIIKTPYEIFDTKERAITSRFLIPYNLESQYLFSLDDDFIIKLERLDNMFQQYKECNLTNQLFGPFARSYKVGNYTGGFHNPYNFVLTGFAFTNANNYQKFNNAQYKKLRDFVDKLNNGEDILMNYVIASTTGLPPATCVIPYEDIAGSGISYKKTFVEERINLLRLIYKSTGHNDNIFPYNDKIIHFE